MFAFPSSGQSSRFLDSGVGFELDNFKLGTHAAQFIESQRTGEIFLD